MRLSEVLGSEAVDRDGNVLGRVHDVRLREEVPDAEGNRRLVTAGLLVGLGSIGARLGYAYGEVRGPWLLHRMLRKLSAGARYVPWRHVASFDGSRLMLAVRGDALAHPIHQRREER